MPAINNFNKCITVSSCWLPAVSTPLSLHAQYFSPICPLAVMMGQMHCLSLPLGACIKTTSLLHSSPAVFMCSCFFIISPSPIFSVLCIDVYIHVMCSLSWSKWKYYIHEVWNIDCYIYLYIFLYKNMCVCIYGHIYVCLHIKICFGCHVPFTVKDSLYGLFMMWNNIVTGPSNCKKGF